MLRALLTLALTLSLISCAAQQRSAAPQSTRDAIAAANRELCDFYNRGDRAAVARMYADNALMIDHHGRRFDGRDAIDNYWTPRRTPTPSDRWELEVLSVEGDETNPVQRGRSRLHSLREGKPHTSDVLFLLFWKKQPDGAYRIILDAWWPTHP